MRAGHGPEQPQQNTMKKTPVTHFDVSRLGSDYARFMNWFGYPEARLDEDFPTPPPGLVEAVTWTGAQGRGFLFVRLAGPLADKPGDLSDEYAAHARGSSLIMAVVASLVDGVREHGCAPMPAPPPEVARDLADMDCRFRDKMGLDCGPAVLTVFPDTAGCADCSLAASCARRKGRGA